MSNPFKSNCMGGFGRGTLGLDIPLLENHKLLYVSFGILIQCRDHLEQQLDPSFDPTNCFSRQVMTALCGICGY